MSTHAEQGSCSPLWEEVWNQNNVAVCDEIFDAEYAAHERAFVPICGRPSPTCTSPSRT